MLLAIFTMIGVLTIPVLSLFVQSVAALRFRSHVIPDEGQSSLAVVIPAHNEEKVIQRTLSGYCAKLETNVEIFVVADNCTDQTVELCRRFPVKVLERNNDRKVGKGYALEFGVEYLKSLDTPPSVVAFVDADSFMIGDHDLSVLSRISRRLNNPYQTGNILQHEDDTDRLARLKSFAWMLKNSVRPKGMRALGLNCMLQGNGMVFPWSVISDVKLGSSNIVEDNKLAVDLARQGVQIDFVSAVEIGSYFEKTNNNVSVQSKRWEGGALELLVKEWPSIVAEFVKTGNRALLGPIIELCIPPVSLLFSLIIVTQALALTMGAVANEWLPFFVSNALVSLFLGAIYFAWRCSGSELRLSDIVWSASYAFRKIPFYIGLIFRRIPKWERATR